MRHRDKTTLKKILNAIEEATEVFGDVPLETFLTSKILKLSMAMSVIRVGELVEALTLEFRRDNLQVPWREVTSYRDVAAHKYETLDFEGLYVTIKEEFPELKLQIEKILMEEATNG